METPFTLGNFEDTPRIQVFDKWLKQAGYIFARRSVDQDLQSSYVSSALLREVIENNKVTTVFQNAFRHRSGKQSHQVFPDLAIKWLLDAYVSMPSSANDLTIVPVMVSYDRIFEAQNLAFEMVNGQRRQLGFKEVLNKL